MAKLEIPSIVVHSGSPSVPGVSMERTARQTPQLRKQKSSIDDGEAVASGCIHHHHSKSDASGPSTSSNTSSCSPNSQTKAETSGGGTRCKPGSPGGPGSRSDSLEVDKASNGPQPQLSRSRSNGKMKMLTRSHAMREATSPPPDPAAMAQTSTTAATQAASPTNSQHSSPGAGVNNNNGKSNGQASKASNYNHNGSGSNHHHTSNNNNYKNKNGNKISKEQNTSSNRPNNHRAQQNKNCIFISSPQEAWGGLLSQDYSTQMQCQDAAKADLLGFIAAQMTTKNRALLLRVEEELKQLVQDQRPIFFRFPQMTSFHRMLVHRAATYFQMDHNLDGSGTCVIVNRNKSTRMPERTFFQVMKDMKGLSTRAYSSEEPRKSILKRDYASFEDSQFKSDEKQLSLESRRSKSFEEREEEYERARRRIFSRDDSTESCQRSESNQDSMEDVRWSECASWPCDEPEPPGRYLRPNDRSGRLMKTESYESRDSVRSNSSRSAVSKSYSFGGYTGTGNGSSNGRLGPSPSHGQSFTGLPRGDSNASSLSAGSRVLAKQDSGSSVSSRLSPSSSGYKSQSQQSDATLSATPSPTATPLSLLPMSSQGSQDTLSPEPPVIWPMTSMGNIPPGSVLINPATGQPICNADGSVYRYDPENPLTLHVPAEGSAKSPTTSQSGRSSEDCAKSVTPEQETGWTGQTSQSPKAPQTPSTPSPKGEAGKPASFQQPPPKAGAQFEKPQADKASSANEQTKTNPADKRNQYNSNSSSSQQREEYRGGKGSSSNSSSNNAASDSSSTASLAVPGAGPERSVTNTATSPMLVAASSPQRPLPLPLPLPLVAATPAAPAGAVAQAPQAAQAPQVQGGAYPVPMVAYSVQPPGPQPPTHYHNGSYAYAAAPPGDGQAFYGGAVPYMAGYTVDPATGSYVAQAQQAQHPPPVGPPPGQPPPVGPPAPPPCCMPGYPCMYATPTGGPPPPGPHTGYDHRGSDVTAQAVNDVTGYMIGMSLNGSPAGPVVDQRAGGDGVGGPVPVRNDGQSPLQGPGGPPTPHIMVAGNGSYYWGPQISSQNQGYPPTVMYYYPPNNVPSPQNATGVAAVGAAVGSAPAAGGSNSTSNYNRGTSPHANARDNSNSKNSSNSTGSATSSSPGSNSRNSYSRNVAASYAKGAAIFQPPTYSMPNIGVAPQTQDRTVINGYPNDCVGVAPPQQQVVYTVSSMHTSTVPTQSYQPSIYSNANAAMAASGAPPGALAYYQGAGDASSQAPGQPQGQPLVPMNPYAGPQGYVPAPGTPPITQTSYGVHPYVYGMYSQTANGPGGPTSPATYPNVAPHQSPMIQRMMRPNLSSPPPRTVGPKGFPRGQSPGARKDHGGSGDNIRFSQPYSMPMYNLAASRYMSAGDMRYMAGRLPFSIPTNSYHRAIRPFQTSYYPRPHSQPSGEALSLTRPPRVRKPT